MVLVSKVTFHWLGADAVTAMFCAGALPSLLKTKSPVEDLPASAAAPVAA